MFNLNQSTGNFIACGAVSVSAESNACELTQIDVLANGIKKLFTRKNRENAAISYTPATSKSH